MIDYTLDLASGKGDPIKTKHLESRAKRMPFSKSLAWKTEQCKEYLCKLKTGIIF